MKNFLLGCLLATVSLFPISLNAQDTQVLVLRFETPCGSWSQVQSLLAEFNEIPFLKMTSNRTVNERTIVNNIILFANSSTKTYTVVERISDRLFCISVTGNDFSTASPTDTLISNPNEPI